MHPPPHPTIDSLQAVLNSREYAQQASGFMLTNRNNFHVDQIGLVLFLWGRRRGMDLQIGYVPEGQEAQLVPHPKRGGRRVVWIHNVAGGLEEGADALGHFSGMRPRRVGRVREFKRGVRRRKWVEELDGKLAAMFGSSADSRD